MMAPGNKAENALAAGCELGEGPVWDARAGCLWFTDIKRRTLHGFDPVSGAHRVFPAPEQIGWVLPASGGKLLAGLRSGISEFDPETGRFGAPLPVPGEPEGNRLNDACAHRDGSVYFGSMDDAESAAVGRFYRFHRGTVEPCGPAGICITNGPAIAQTTQTIYFTDSAGRKIYAAPLGDHGEVGAVTLFVDTADHFPDAWPDGPVCDALGRVWCGLWNGWGVACFDPQGKLIGKVDLPVANVTKLAFGGHDLRQAFVTTARQGLSAEALAAQPMAGDLFVFESDVTGCPAALAQIGG